jgi:hypothetical protein
MKTKPLAFAPFLIFALAGVVWSDQITLKNGQEYSGKFVRGDSNVVEFQILGRTETFNIADVARITFTGTAAVTPSAVAPKAAAPQLQTPPPVQPSATQRSAASTITVPEGTSLTIRTTTAIDTDRNRVGDTFDAILDEALTLNDTEVAPRGTLLKGRIAYAKESGKLTGQSELRLELTDITLNGKTYTLNTSDYVEAGASRGKRTAATVGGTAALGTIIGAIAGGGKGAAIGAASGAAVGTGVQVMTKGQTLKVPAETILEFQLQSPLTIDAK